MFRAGLSTAFATAIALATAVTAGAQAATTSPQEVRAAGAPPAVVTTGVKAPADYVAGGGTLTFAAGVTTQTVTNKIKGDLLNEGDECEREQNQVDHDAWLREAP